MTKGNLIDIVRATAFVAFWTLVLRSSSIPIQNIALLWALFLVFDIFATLLSKRAMKNQEKNKITKHTFRQFVFSMSFILFIGLVSFFNMGIASENTHVQSWILILIILYTNFLLLASTLVRAGLKLVVARPWFK